MIFFTLLLENIRFNDGGLNGIDVVVDQDCIFHAMGRLGFEAETEHVDSVSEDFPWVGLLANCRVFLQRQYVRAVRIRNPAYQRLLVH